MLMECIKEMDKLICDKCRKVIGWQEVIDCVGDTHYCFECGDTYD